MDVPSLVSSARRSSGRPYRSVAADAAVAVSTIVRIETAAIDPTLPTLERILGACGFDLLLVPVRTATPQRPRLADLVEAWSTSAGHDHLVIDWTRWRALLDSLALRPEWVPEAIYLPPAPAGHPVIDALLAGVAEKLADDARLPRPSWTEAVPSLDEPFAPPARRRGEVPPQLAARGVLVDSTSLFRDRATVGL